MANPWKSTRKLTHPFFQRARLRVEWLNGRWVPLSLDHANGRQEDGQTALNAYGLRIREPFHPIPQLEEV